MADSIVIMGVAGCGKSSLGAAVAAATGLTLVEGDDYHSTSSRDKMRLGIALTDADRDGWLGALCEQLRAHPAGLVLTCSALKKAYRERLRQAAPGLRFVFLEISREQALARVAARGAGHFFSPRLIDSQFETLELPGGEPGVLCVDALAPISQLQADVGQWLRVGGAGMTIPTGTGAPARRARLYRLTDALMAACLGVMAVAVFVNVVLRYGFGSGIAASEELSRLLFVWMVFIGATAAYPAGEHMAFTSLVGALQQRPRAMLAATVLIRLLVLLACVLIGAGAWQQVAVGLGSHSVILGYPTALLPLPALLCAVAIGVMAFVELVKRQPLHLGHGGDAE